MQLSPLAVYARDSRMGRRKKRNPIAGVPDQTIDVSAMLAGVVLFAMGAHRWAGAVAVTNGVYQLSRDRRLTGWANLIVGASFLLFPNWPAALSSKGGSEEPR